MNSTSYPWNSIWMRQIGILSHWHSPMIRQYSIHSRVLNSLGLLDCVELLYNAGVNVSRETMVSPNSYSARILTVTRLSTWNADIIWLGLVFASLDLSSPVIGRHEFTKKIPKKSSITQWPLHNLLIYLEYFPISRRDRYIYQFC